MPLPEVKCTHCGHVGCDLVFDDPGVTCWRCQSCGDQHLWDHVTDAEIIRDLTMLQGMEPENMRDMLKRWREDRQKEWA